MEAKQQELTGFLKSCLSSDYGQHLTAVRTPTQIVSPRNNYNLVLYVFSIFFLCTVLPRLLRLCSELASLKSYFKKHYHHTWSTCETLCNVRDSTRSSSKRMCSNAYNLLFTVRHSIISHLNSSSGGWEMAQWVKHFPCKHEDLRSNPRNSDKADCSSTCLQSLCCSYKAVGGRDGRVPGMQGGDSLKSWTSSSCPWTFYVVCGMWVPALIHAHTDTWSHIYYFFLFMCQVVIFARSRHILKVHSDNCILFSLVGEKRSVYHNLKV